MMFRVVPQQTDAHTYKQILITCDTHQQSVVKTFETLSRSLNQDRQKKDETAFLKDCHCLVADWWCHLLLPCKCKISPSMTFKVVQQQTNTQRCTHISITCDTHQQSAVKSLESDTDNLKRHMLKVHVNETNRVSASNRGETRGMLYQCKKCGKRFLSQELVNKHMMVHR